MGKIRKINLDALFAIFAVLVAAVMLTGIISYSNMVRQSRSASNEILPQQQLFILGSLVGELQNAENSIRGFRLSRDPIWMQSFYDHSVGCNKKLIDLADLANKYADKHLQIAQLSGLIQQKLETLESYSQLADRASVVSELEGISRQLELHTDTVTEQKQQSFIRSLFSRERNNNSNNSKQDSLHIRVLEEVEQIRRKQSLRLMSIDALELEYIIKISEIRDQIEDEVSAMRFDALRMVEEAANERESSQLHANYMIRVFSIAAVIFLLLGGFSVFSYLQKRRQYERALKLAKSNAEAYSAMQERFAANMSHEVRTPLHAIAGFTEQLQFVTDDEKQQEYLSLTKTAIRHLKQVVDDILDYSKLKVGKMKLMMEPFYPKKEIDSVVAIFQMEIKLKGLFITVNNKLPANIALMGDALRFRQLLINIISNAIKFTKKGGLRLKLFTEQLQDQRQMLFIEVEDTGVGMSKEQLEKIFMPFEQADNINLSDYRGTGLGLTITREIIEQQGGRISVESKLGEGTMVTVSIPYMEAEYISEIKSEEDRNETFSLKGLKILIADDEEWNRKLTEAMLSKYEAKTTIVEDGIQAIEKIGNESFDLFLLDLRMPGKSGYEVAKSIRAAYLSPPPIVALTAHTVKDHETLLRSAGIIDKLIKPFSEEELLEMIKKVMMTDFDFKDSEIATAATTSDNVQMRTVSGVDGNEYFDKGKISKLGEGDQEFIREMMVIFVDNALNALSYIEEAVKNNDSELINWHTHKLAPPARQIGAYKMLALVKELEEAVRKEKTTNVLMAIFNSLKIETTQLVTTLKESYLKDS